MTIAGSIRCLLIAVAAAMGCGAAVATEPSDISVTVGKADEAYVVEAAIDAPVAPRTAWEVLIDFDHMTSILENLTSSKVTHRDGNTWIVKQEGVARYGLFSYSFQSEREIRLEPTGRILTRSLSGTAKRMESEVRLMPAEPGPGVRISYRAEIVPDSTLGRLFGASFLRHEIEEQFRLLVAEMRRRESPAEHGAAGETK